MKKTILITFALQSYLARPASYLRLIEEEHEHVNLSHYLKTKRTKQRII